LLKAYFLCHGGYSLRGSNPAPDIYAVTGWIPERISLREGFQREKEWRRILSGFQRGEVLVALGTGKNVRTGLVPLHAYGVLGTSRIMEKHCEAQIAEMREEGGERYLDVLDPGSPGEAARQASLVSAMDTLSMNGPEGETGASFTLLTLYDCAKRQTGVSTMTWDDIAADFDELNLNWDPALRPITTTRHW
jgi:calpain-7